MGGKEGGSEGGREGGRGRERERRGRGEREGGREEGEEMEGREVGTDWWVDRVHTLTMNLEVDQTSLYISLFQVVNLSYR